jgi:2-phospho-L-lactate guanylyltransferase
MPVVIVVPTKCFDHGKSRLSKRLAPPSRAEFARGLFARVVGAATACREVSGVLVATDCDCVVEAARALGVAVARDAAPSLAAVVDAALARVAAEGAGAAVVLMSDLPLIEPRDLAELARLIQSHDVVVVPDEPEVGTNALALAPPDRIATAFGSGESFARHCAAAARAGLRLCVHRSARLGFDVDGPEDLSRLRARAS